MHKKTQDDSLVLGKTTAEMRRLDTIRDHSELLQKSQEKAPQKNNPRTDSVTYTTALEHGVQTVKKRLKEAPMTSGVYHMLDQHRRILYIGKAKYLPKRLVSYTRPEVLPIRLKRMISLIHDVEWVVTRSEVEALLLEMRLIKKHQPPYNVALKDDKGLLYVVLSQHAYPRLVKVRGKRALKEYAEGSVFGPFLSVRQVDHAIEEIQKTFLLRQCSDHYFATRDRPCLQYHIKRCSAPCKGRISQSEYYEDVQQAQSFFEGNKEAVQLRLEAKMELASEELRYEEALLYRDRIKALAQLQMSQALQWLPEGDRDLIYIKVQEEALVLMIAFVRHQTIMSIRAIPVLLNRVIRSKSDTLEQQVEIEGLVYDLLLQFYSNTPLPDILTFLFMPCNKVGRMLLKESLEQLQLQSDGSKSDTIEQLYLNKASQTSEKIVSTLDRDQLSLKKSVSKGVVFEVGIAGDMKSDSTNKAKKRLNYEAQEHSERFLMQQRSCAFWLRSLQEYLSAHIQVEDLRRIEVYDNSHLQGSYQVGCYVVYGEEGWQKAQYRSYNMDDPKIRGDDYAMMREVLKRRFSGKSASITPDLLIIDGGKGQLNVALEALEAVGCAHIPLVALAKGEGRKDGLETLYVKQAETLFTCDLKQQPEVLRFLINLRDEAHRFAVGSYRRRHKKQSLSDLLSVIPGVGSVRKKRLLNYFGSYVMLSQASATEISKVPGISEALAEKIALYLEREG